MLYTVKLHILHSTPCVAMIAHQTGRVAFVTQMNVWMSCQAGASTLFLPSMVKTVLSSVPLGHLKQFFDIQVYAFNIKVYDLISMV
jgi:hypothetical protein